MTGGGAVDGIEASASCRRRSSCRCRTCRCRSSRPPRAAGTGARRPPWDVLAGVHQLHSNPATPRGAGSRRSGCRPADHDQRVDAELQQVARCPPTTIPLKELHRPGRPDRAAARRSRPHPPTPSGGWHPRHGSAPRLGHRVDVDAVMHRCPHHRADGWVHARRRRRWSAPRCWKAQLPSRPQEQVKDPGLSGQLVLL